MSNMGPAHSSVDASAMESEGERMSRAKDLNDKVKNLIGPSSFPFVPYHYSGLTNDEDR